MAKCRGVLRILSDINGGDFNKKSSIRILNRVLNMLLKSVRKGPSQYLLIPYKHANITFLRYCKLAWENFQSVSLYRDCRSAISINHQRVKEMPSPLPCSPVIFEWLWKEAQIKKNVWTHSQELCTGKLLVPEFKNYWKCSKEHQTLFS